MAHSPRSYDSSYFSDRHEPPTDLLFAMISEPIMTFLTIATIQMPVDSTRKNISSMVQHVDALMLRLPSVRMVILMKIGGV